MMPHVGIVYCVESMRIITTVNSAGLLVDIVEIHLKQNSNQSQKPTMTVENIHDNLPTQMDETV